MDIFTREVLNRLASDIGSPCVSIYMPTHRVGRETQQDPIRLKNLLTDAAERLEKRGMGTAEIDKFLEPGFNLQSLAEFWQKQSDGLAVYITPKNFFYYRVPIAFEELVIVGDTFHLKPILPLLEGNGRFFILALSQNAIRLLEGTRDLIREIPLEGVPTSLVEALEYDDPERELQFHTRTRPSPTGGGRDAIFHGMGSGELDSKNDILRFFHKINAGVMDRIKEAKAPLVAAGVEFLIPIYREANSYPHMLGEHIEGNPETLNETELHKRGWQIVEPIFQEEQNEAAERYQALAGSQAGQASQEIKEIVPAAINGRIDTLFVDQNERIWGRFNAETQEVTISEENRDTDQDLLDLAAVQTLLNQGAVFAVDQDDMPARGSAAAIFRYEIRG
jgi:hypothetical protein